MAQKMMKAAVLHANDDIRYEDVPMPEIGPGEVLVRVRGAGICGSDLPRVHDNGAFFYPIILGHEFAGDVVEIGEGVTSVSVGDKISGTALMPCFKCEDCQKGNYALCKNYSFIGSRQNGAFCDYVALPERNCVKCDPSLTYDQAVLFEPATVAIHGLRVTGLTGGATVAVLGAGTVGNFTAQAAKVFGAEQVVVFDIDQTRLDLSVKLGADAGVNTSEPDFMDKAMELTGGRGFDFVYEVAGVPATMAIAFEIAARQGTIGYIGYPHVPVTFQPKNWENMNLKELKVIGTRMSYTAPYPGKDWTLTAHYFATGQIKCDESMVYKHFAMKDAQKAFDCFKTPGLVTGKIILVNDLPTD